MPKRMIKDRSKIEAFLQQQTVGRLGLSSDNEPYVVPLCYVFHRNAIYFHSALQGKKIAIMQKNPRVCFQVDKIETVRTDPSPCNFSITYCSVIVFGTVSEVTEPEEKEDVLQTLASIYVNSGKFAHTFSASQVQKVKVFKIIINDITAKENNSGFNSEA